MVNQTVDIVVEPDASWPYGTRVQVFTDWGDGSIDTDRPLLKVPFDPWREKPRPRGFGEGAFGEVPFGHTADELLGDGFGEHGFGDDDFGGGTKAFRVAVQVTDAVGSWKFAAKAVDEAGNVQSAGLNESTIIVSGRNPKPLRDFAYSSFDEANGQVTFTYSS